MDQDVIVLGSEWLKDRCSLPCASVDGSISRIDLQSVGLKFQVVGDLRHCTGYYKWAADGSFSRRTCEERNAAASGGQCRFCKDRDESRFIHAAHRGAWAPEAVKLYLDQPHWLYVALFADGSSKVGTAADSRKYVRLAEQGAVVATFIGRFPDGRRVRLAEDGISRLCGVPQNIRAEAKVRGWLAPLPKEELVKRRERLVSSIEPLLGGLCGPLDATSTREHWVCNASELFHVASGPHRMRYPNDLSTGAVNLTVLDVCGDVALCCVAAEHGLETDEYLVDLRQLRGVRVRFGEHEVALPPVQSALF